MIDASVIIPVLNGANDLPDCLTAIQQQSISNFEVIAVDNGSSDGSAEFIASEFPDVHLIRNKTNIGFGPACNIGLRAATGNVLVLLNQDTVVEQDWLAALVDFLDANPDVGIAGSKAYFVNGNVQHAGAQVTTQGHGRHYGHNEPDQPSFDDICDVDFVTGASLW